MRSMTGFGRASGALQIGEGAAHVVVEMRAVNHKGLDVKVRLPRSHGALDDAIGKRVRARLERGRVDVSVDVVRAGPPAVDARLLFSLAHAAREWAKQVNGDARLTAGELLHASLLLPRMDVDPLQSDDVQQAVLQVADDALEALVASREQEGGALAHTLESHVARIDALRLQLADRTRLAPERLRERTLQRIAALGVTLDAGRLAQEVALLVDRVDVTEELSRLAMHVERFRALCAEPRSGRALDFLCQELLREANTTGSKCQDAEVAHLVVELKTEIERAREQAQNVE